MKFVPALCAFQGLYFFLTGVWPILSIRTFEAVTGPKTDDWLVKTVGVLIAVIGAVLLAAGFHANVTPEIAMLAVGSAFGLTGIDVWYVAQKVISPIYLLDAAVEVILIGLWGFAWVVES